MALTPIAVWNGMNDIFSMPKELVVLLAATSSVLAGVWRLTASGELRVPRTHAIWLVGGVGLAAALATALGDHVALSVFGEYGRSAGLATLLATIVLFVATLTSFDETSLGRLAQWFAGAVAIVLLYGLLEMAGAEPLGLTVNGGAMPSLLGQPNYVGGFVGIGLPFLLWVGLVRWRGWQGVAFAGASAGAALAVAAGSQSFQAWPSLGAGVATFAVVYALDRWSARVVGLAIGGLMLIGVLAGLVVHSPIETQVRSGLDERVLMWRAGGQMVVDRPVLGWGPSGYAAKFTTYRPRAHAVRFGTTQLVDAPHDVPLSMFVTGGATLGLLYLAFVGHVGLQLVRGFRRTTGERRLLLGTFGGAWLAYQAQSVVSIDMPTLMVEHFVFAAAVLFLAGPPDFRLMKVHSLAPIRRGRKIHLPTAGWVVRGAVGALAVVGFVLVIRPVVADAAFAHALDLRASAGPEQAIAPLKRATSMAGWNGQYSAQLAAVEAASGDQDAALVAGIKAADASPSRATYALSLAQLAERMNRLDIADKYYRFAVEHSPNEPIVNNAMVEYLLRRKQFRRAIPPALEAVAGRPDNADIVANMARAYQGAGRDADARRTWTRVLAIRADYPDALRYFGRPVPPT